MARTGSSTVGTTETLVFQSDRKRRNGGEPGTDSGPPFKAIRVNCTSASAVSLQARIPSKHGTSKVTIPAGESREFVATGGDGRTPLGDELYLSGLSGTATYTWEVIA